MKMLHNLLGQSFNFLTVIARSPRERAGDSGWLCRCVCGKEIKVQSPRLRSGRIKSCGCKRTELISASNSIHGHWVGGKPSGEWVSWRSAIDRCHNPLSTSFARYGGAGVTVCDEWRGSFSAFLSELGPRPDGSSLDRIDGTKGYEPGNCRWSTPKEQSGNLKNNRFVIVSGERMTIRAAADRFALPYSSFRNRLYRSGQYISPTGNLFTLIET